jgi:hypothetical protein
MIVAPVRATSLFETEGNRLDARYFSAPAVRIRSILAASGDVELRSIGGKGGLATVTAPSRFKRTYATPGEEYISYLRPYDVFEFLPPEADRLSVSRTAKLDDYRIKAGDLLQTCSGRNLGPLTIADAYLARFALSHDMIRISIDDEADRYYTLAFLRSRTGQHLLRGDLSGSVIDHITPEQVSAVQVSIIGSIRDKVAALTKEATGLRELARITLHGAVEQLNAKFPSTPDSPYREGWTVRAAALGTRLDAAFHSAHVHGLRARVLADGGIPLGDVGEVQKPGGRYKTYYVGADQGTPLLSGRQILQLDVVGAKNISSRSVKADAGYELRPGWITFQADGRAEESLGYPSVVTGERDGWFASGHVGRVIPNDPVDSGWLWAAIASDVVQDQIAALACGSVVDALYPETLTGVVLPPRHLVDSAVVNAAWADLAAAAAKADKATRVIEDSLTALGV